MALETPIVEEIPFFFGYLFERFPFFSNFYLVQYTPKDSHCSFYYREGRYAGWQALLHDFLNPLRMLDAAFDTAFRWLSFFWDCLIVMPIDWARDYFGTNREEGTFWPKLIDLLLLAVTRLPVGAFMFVGLLINALIGHTGLPRPFANFLLSQEDKSAKEIPCDTLSFSRLIRRFLASAQDSQGPLHALNFWGWFYANILKSSYQVDSLEVNGAEPRSQLEKGQESEPWANFEGDYPSRVGILYGFGDLPYQMAFKVVEAIEGYRARNKNGF